MTAKEVEAVVLEIAPLENAHPGDPTGLLYGDPNTQVSGIAVTWTPSVRVLEQAACDGMNFVLTHEIPFFSSVESRWFRTLEENDKPHNIARRRLLDAYGMVLCRCHSNWDLSPGGVMESAAKALGLERVAHQSPGCATYDIEPTTVAELAARAKERLGVPLIRVTHDTGRTVRRVTLHYGGLLQMPHGVDEAVLVGADVIICGEALDYSWRAAVDAGIALIETAHVNSENPGMRNFARLLAERFEDLPVRFIDAGLPWTYM